MDDEDLLALIVNKISNPDDRRSFSEVCKQWLRVEGLNRSSLRLLRTEYLHQVLPRFPNLLTFETSKPITQTNLKFIAQTCRDLEAINLSTKDHPPFKKSPDYWVDGMSVLAKGCPKLSRVMLRRRSVNVHLTFLNSAHNLTHLDLGHCLVLDEDLEAIGSCSSISYLNLKWGLITDEGLGFLANGSCSKTLKTLILAQCDEITDVGVSLLHKMSCLEYLNLAWLPKVTDIGGVAVSEIGTLKKLNLSSLYKISDCTIAALAENCRNLEVLNISRCSLVTGAGIRAFSTHPYLESLVYDECV
ncbi:F-box/LRR-repeat protein 3-like [Rosa sericea]